VEVAPTVRFEPRMNRHVEPGFTVVVGVSRGRDARMPFNCRRIDPVLGEIRPAQEGIRWVRVSLRIAAQPRGSGPGDNRGPACDVGVLVLTRCTHQDMPVKGSRFGDLPGQS
jgi:hypothetical protein